MEMKEKHSNPNSHEHLRQDTSRTWSELPKDLLTLVVERLGFTDFERAKSVCSSWYSGSRDCMPKKQTTPWLILFPEEDKDKNSCTLFNPGEKDKLYKTQDLGLDFTKSMCLTTYGSWFLMRDRLYNLYILNIFTQERINLPSPHSYLDSERIQSSVLWIDEKTKDYVVMRTLYGFNSYCTKKGDKSWNQCTPLKGFQESFADMVYKDHKLYILTCSASVIIFDFSGEIPRETFRCENILNNFRRYREFKLVVTLKGDVLIVERGLYNVYKVYSSSRFFKERVYSLGDEAMLFDLGITVLANDVEGLQRNYIYFNGSNKKNKNVIRLFNLGKPKMESLHKFDCSPVRVSKARWFVPSFKSY